MTLMETAQLLGNFGEFVGAFAVVLTLFYLAIQVKNAKEATDQNTAALRSQASIAVNDGLWQLQSALYADADMTDIWTRGLSSLGDLDPIEKERFEAYALTRLNLAAYMEVLEQQGAEDVHIDYIDWLTRLIDQNSGLKEFVLSLRDGWAASDKLYRRLVSEA